MEVSLRKALVILRGLERDLGKKYSVQIRYDGTPSFLKGSPNDLLKVIILDLRHAKIKRSRYFKYNRTLLIVLADNANEC